MLLPHFWYNWVAVVQGKISLIPSFINDADIVILLRFLLFLLILDCSERFFMQVKRRGVNSAVNLQTQFNIDSFIWT